MKLIYGFCLVMFGFVGQAHAQLDAPLCSVEPVIGCFNDNHFDGRDIFGTTKEENCAAFAVTFPGSPLPEACSNNFVGEPVAEHIPPISGEVITGDGSLTGAWQIVNNFSGCFNVFQNEQGKVGGEWISNDDIAGGSMVFGVNPDGSGVYTNVSSQTTAGQFFITKVEAAAVTVEWFAVDGTTGIWELERISGCG